jgi:hypothetical protein
MLFMVLLHVSYVTATETKTKREAKLFPKFAFDINPAFTSVRSTQSNHATSLPEPEKVGSKERWRHKGKLSIQSIKADRSDADIYQNLEID